jgi:hypothetical protein
LARTNTNPASGPSNKNAIDWATQRREPTINSVGYFPERYGKDLVRVAVDLLNRRAVPPAVFIKHHLITPETVDHFYPNDSLMSVAQV